MRSVEKGFSLIEIMVVVVIIGMISTFVATNVIGALNESKKQKVKADFSQLESALKLYRLDNSFYPSTEQGLEALVRKPDVPPEPRNWRRGGYIDRLPMDPWQSPYRYYSPVDEYPYEISTLGSDRAAGGDDESADMSNWIN